MARKRVQVEIPGPRTRAFCGEARRLNLTELDEAGRRQALPYQRVGMAVEDSDGCPS